MQAGHLSDSLDSLSDHSDLHHSQTTYVGFQLTPEDIDILEQRLEEFGEADTKAWAKLVQNIMGELY